MLAPEMPRASKLSFWALPRCYAMLCDAMRCYAMLRFISAVVRIRESSAWLWRIANTPWSDGLTLASGIDGMWVWAKFRICTPKDPQRFKTSPIIGEMVRHMSCHGLPWPSYAECRVRLNNSYSKDDLYLCPLCGLEFDPQLLDIACPYYSLLLKCPQGAD